MARSFWCRAMKGVNSPRDPVWVVPTLPGHVIDWVTSSPVRPIGRRMDKQSLLPEADIEFCSKRWFRSSYDLDRHGVPAWIRWSPDAKKLRFTVNDLKTGTESLWEAGADGTDLHRLLPGWNNPPSECCGAWTPDGRYFVFQSTRAVDRTSGRYARKGRYQENLAGNPRN